MKNCPLCGTTGVALLKGFQCENPLCRNFAKKTSSDESTAIENEIKYLWSFFKIGDETLEEFSQKFFADGGRIYHTPHGKNKTLTIKPQWLSERILGHR